ncbi:MAG: 30S ribosomal protein S12 methylthiotransferase RimO [Fimbriimonadales bacterium]|nr:30S ribosomal protein S12 methylthiotransferase RimO [Fimbriimonadales bacterium]
MPRKPIARIITLGCAKNEVDSEEIAGVLAEHGYALDGLSDRSDVTVINTCGFLEASKRESLEAIRAALKDRAEGRTRKVVVAGCLVQRLGQELKRLAPGADAYVGVGQMGRFAEVVAGARGGSLVSVDEPHHVWADVRSRARSGPSWTAYLKLSEGCDHQCAFCTIPSFRGRHKSKPIERIVEEAEWLARGGAREICLIAQDTTQYGHDLYGRFRLPDVIRMVAAVDGVRWVRALYLYPTRVGDDLLEVLERTPQAVRYIDMPLQHSHPDVLRRMRRPWDGERYLRLFEKIRAALPGVAIRTTFIVGYPGETEEEFQHVLDFLRAARLDRVGCFAYSRESGTPAAELPGQISFREKQRRQHELMSLQQNISLEINRGWIGRRLEVLVEGATDEGWGFGRTYRDAPEIDGLVYLQGARPLGSFCEATITDADPYDLFAASPATRSVRRAPKAPL